MCSSDLSKASPQALRQVRLAAGETIPFDRIYAIENGPGPFDPDRPEHLPKIHFCTLMRHEQLAKLKTEFDTATHTLSLWHNGALAARGDLRVSQGRHAIANFIAGYMAQALRGARDMKIPSFLSRTLGHADFGVYARVVDGGHIAIGDQVTL